MTVEYRVVEKVGDIPLDENLVNDFLNYLNSVHLPKTHVLSGDDEEANPYFNKYIIHDSIFEGFFYNRADYEFFIKGVIHTSLFPPRENIQQEHILHSLVGSLHSFFMEYYKQFFLIRVSVTITDPESFMHYHRDLAGEHADRFLVDITHPENEMSGIEVEDRLYKLDRFGVYKLDTTRMHRGANYSPNHKKISFIIQCISELDQYLEYQRKHLEVFFDTLGQLPPSMVEG